MKTKLMLLVAGLLIINTFAQTENRREASKFFFYDDQFGALVKNDNTVAITRNGGMDWTNVKLETSDYLRKIMFTSHMSGWLVGDNKIYKTVDGGLTWEENYFSVELFSKTIYFINEYVGFIGGRYGTPDGFASIFYTKDEGENWNSTNMDSLVYSSIIDFSFANDSVGIAVGGVAIYKTSNHGKNWEKLPVEFPTGGHQAMSATMLNEHHVILVTWYPDVVALGVLRESTDGGLTWSNFGNGQDFTWGIRDLFVQNRDSIWLTTGFKTFYTINGGFYWDTVDVRLTDFSFITANEAFGLTEKYILHTYDGWKNYSIVDSIITEVNEEIDLPQKFYLSQNYPNPFNPSTRIKYQVASIEKVSIKIYDVLGREIKTLVNEIKAPGSYEVEFDGSQMSSGVYFYVLETGGKRLSKKMLLLK